MSNIYWKANNKKYDIIIFCFRIYIIHVYVKISLEPDEDRFGRSKYSDYNLSSLFINYSYTYFGNLNTQYRITVNKVILKYKTVLLYIGKKY